MSYSDKFHINFISNCHTSQHHMKNKGACITIINVIILQNNYKKRLCYKFCGIKYFIRGKIQLSHFNCCDF